MLTWGTLKTQVRRSLLKDTSDVHWDDNMMLDYCEWALATFANHTAVATATSYTPTSDQKQFTLPDNIFESIEFSGAVYVQSSTGVREYLNPVRYTMNGDLQDTNGYFVHPEGTLNLVSPRSSTDKLVVEYFAYYDVPSNDQDIIKVPKWAHMPIAYMMAVHAMTNMGIQQANISQWKDRRDGDPEDNALRVQQEWLLKLYERELNKHQAQDRINFFRPTG
ncbi:MAG: hypothetical protein CUN55_00515 [Phototrophicales bacterium]|nr:MAG: hypothetical protein CUN55_00515 [Phototrophicales bacterium]